MQFVGVHGRFASFLGEFFLPDNKSSDMCMQS